jgi:zinc protease
MTRAVVSLVLLAVVVVAAPGDAGLHTRREVLPNGIVLLVAERPAVPIVVVRVFLRAGAVLDPLDRAGLANLTGAVLTRGTAKRTGPELDSMIEFVGGALEAGAGQDGMRVALSVLRKDLTLGLDLMQEVLLSPAFPEAEVTRKAREIQAAITRSEENPEAVASRALGPLVFPSHPYGTPTEGTRESVGRLTRDDVVRFYQQHARPDTATVVVVGAITADEARREVLARLGPWAKPAAPPPTVPTAPGNAPPKTDNIQRDLTQATILLGRQAIRQTDPDYFPLAVASYIVGGGSASRLYSRVRDEGGLAYSVYSAASPGKYGASLVVGAQTRTTEAKRVVELIREELSRIGRERVTERELELAKSYLIGSFPLRLDTSRKVADFLVAIEENGLGLDYRDRYTREIARVTAADVQRVAAKFFAPDTFSRVIVGTLP